MEKHDLKMMQNAILPDIVKNDGTKFSKKINESIQTKRMFKNT